MLFTFRARSYFPALATCLPAFSVGYYLQAKEGVILLVVSGVLTLTLWFASLWLSVKAIYGIQGLLLLTVIGLFMLLRVEWISVWILGMFLTLAMGVSEAWRVTTSVLAGLEYRPNDNYSLNEQRSFLSGANVATALFLPLFLSTYLHLQTESSYLPFVMVWLLAGSLVWFRYGSSANYRRMSLWAAVFGISLPLELAVAAHMKGEIALPEPPLACVGGMYSIMAGLLAVVMGVSLKTHKQMPRTQQALVEHYAQPNNAIALTGAVCGFFAFVGLLSIVFAGGPSTRYDRFNWLILIYVLFAAAASGWAWWVAQPGPKEEAANATQLLPLADENPHPT
ncbi:hypothetical protein [Longimicrobium sp.]|uniref:hypothetical protein n=1 Tax=Longimicrobium sp. TaxID=2029185 RepID=UPI002B9C7BA3|nr:hypothetical protein [Longimicrobium sp.]HSU17224.1 hypothetical protein [Longimicrobium sp.]